MNRRKFFSAVAAAVTAVLVPASSRDYRHILERAGYPFDRKGPGYIAARYGSTHAWWRPRETFVHIGQQDFAALEVRTLAALQTAWKECITHRSKAS